MPPPPGAAWLPLGRGRAALIDACDLAIVSGRVWYENRARRRVHDGRVSLHRLIMGAPPGEVVDHASGDYLDNRRANLRRCNVAENVRNAAKHRGPTSSRFKGVSLHRPSGRWCAFIRRGGKNAYLGTWASEEEAAQAYDIAAREVFGAFACVNFPREGERAAG